MKKVSFLMIFAFLFCELYSHAQKQTILNTIDTKVVNNPAQPMRASDLNAILKSILNYPVDTVWFVGDTLKYKVNGVTKNFRFTGYQDSLANVVKTYGSYTNPSFIVSLPYSKITGTPSDLPPSGSAGGDLSGTYPNPAVAKLNGQLPSYYVDRANHTGTQAQSTIVNLADSLDAIRVRNNTKLAITDAASTYTTIARTLDSLAAVQARIQTKEPLLGFTPVPNTRTINGYPLTGNITLNKSDVGLGNVDNTSDANKPISTATQTALDGKVPTTRTVNGYALSSNITLNKSDVGLSNVPNTDATNASNISSGTLPDARLSSNVTVQGNTFNGSNQLVKLDAGGKLPTSTIPSLALVETFVVNSQAAMLALSAQMGDVAVRTDNNRSYILQSEPASTLSNWVQLLTPDSETDPVYTASSWYSTTNNASDWNTAYSWGNHASAGYALTSGSYSNPSWIISLAWSKLTGVPSTFTPSAHTHPYSDLTGTVPTWNQNTTGNAATATNATQWSGNNYGGSYSTGGIFGFMINNNTTAAWERATVAQVQSALSLGSYAYRSSGLAELSSGPTFAGTVTAPQLSAGQINATGPGGSAVVLYGSYSGSPANAGMVINNYLGTTTFSHNSNGGATTTTGTMTAASFTGAGTGLTGTASSLTAQRSNELNTLGSYVWAASTLPNSYNNALMLSFVHPGDGWQDYGTVITAKGYNGGGGGTLQMYVPYSPSIGGTGLQVRFGNYDVSGGNSWTSWKTLLATDNYNSYAPSLTGTGASGTWGINVTGQSLLLGASGSSLTAQRGNGTVALESAITEPQAGLFTTTDNSNAIITINRHPGNYYSQLGFNSTGSIFYRSFNNTAINTSLAWQTLLTSSNFSSYAMSGAGYSANQNLNTSSNVSFATIDGSLIRSTGDVIAYYTSDRRLKKNIKPIANALDKLNLLSGNEYDWDETLQSTYKGHDYGVIAQEVESVLPGVTHKKADGFFGIKNQNQIIALLVQAIKELKNEVEILKK